MKHHPLSYPVLLLLAPLWMTAPAAAENIEHVQQLLATKACTNCDLSNTGLVFANLSKANLQGADLSNANLSRANLSQADLSGANLTGAILYGANLTGAKLNSTNLSGADLRGAYLSNTEVADINLSNANLQGVVGLPSQVGNAKDFFNWALTASEKGQYGRAIENYTQAISIDSNLGAAYLGRGLAQFRSGNQKAALADSKQASQIFLAQGDETGHQAASSFITLMETPSKEDKVSGGVGNIAGSVFSLGLSVLKMFVAF
jgi:uncharacterized protein YjbI with pentapeptide repeats